MRSKKNINSDLESKRRLFFQTGLIAAMAISLMAFEWSTGELDDLDIDLYDEGTVLEPEEPVLERKIFNKPQPTKKEQPANEIKIVKKIIKQVHTLDTTINIDTSLIFDPDLPIDTTGTTELPVLDTSIVETVEVKAAFEGGQTALMEFLNKNIRFPEQLKEIGGKERVYVRFVVEPDGSVSNVKAIKGKTRYCKKEAVRVTKLIPSKWTPGMVNGKPVRSYFVLPFSFVGQ